MGVFWGKLPGRRGVAALGGPLNFFGVGNVQGALTIGKAFDITGVGNVGKLHQPQKN
jgi:hypothetical protein